MEKRYFIFVKYVLVIIATIALIAGLSAVAVTSKAEAVPENLEESLDEASCAYYDAVMAQEELKAKIESSKEQIEDCTNQINGIKSRVMERMKYSYTHEARMLIEIFLGADTVRDLFNTLNVMEVINARDMRLLSKYTDLQTKLKAETASMEANQATLEQQVKAAKEAYDKAQKLLNDAKSAEAGYASGVFLPANTGNEIADRALREQGKPYVWGAVGPVGYDCSGLASYATCGQHVRLGTTTTFMGWPKLDEPEVGCICTNSHHCGIYVGNGMMCHAPTTGQVVCCTTVPADMIYVRYPG